MLGCFLITIEGISVYSTVKKNPKTNKRLCNFFSHACLQEQKYSKNSNIAKNENNFFHNICEICITIFLMNTALQSKKATKLFAFTVQTTTIFLQNDTHLR